MNLIVLTQILNSILWNSILKFEFYDDLLLHFFLSFQTILILSLSPLLYKISRRLVSLCCA